MIMSITMVSFTLGITIVTISTLVIGSRCPPVCHCTGKTVFCEGKMLDRVPAGIPNDTQVLNIVQTRISVVSFEDFEFLLNLTTLNMKDNRITKLTGTFVNNRQIVKLDLSGNRLSIFPAGVMRGLTSLRSIHLSHNRLKCIPDLASATSLERLYLDNNEISNSTFPDGYRELRNLKEVVLDDNESFGNIELQDFESLNATKITRLTMENCGIRQMAYAALAHLQHLRQLSVARNWVVVKHADDLFNFSRGMAGTNIEELDMSKVFQGLRFLSAVLFDPMFRVPLRKLSLAHSDIYELAAECFKSLPSITHLNLSYVKISNLRHGALGGLVNLSVLDLSYNRIEKLDDTFLHEMENLKVVNFSHNMDLKQLPISDKVQDIKADHCSITSFSRLARTLRLRALDLSYNYLSRDIFKGFPISDLSDLVTLDLKENSLMLLTKYQDDFWDMAANLIRIDFSDCQLKSTNGSFFDGFQMLKILILNGNSLGMQLSEDIHGRTFEGLGNLTELHLQKNSLTFLPAALFQDLVKLERIHLANNHLDHWESGLFQPLTNLHLADFSFNRILVINQTSLAYVTPLLKFNFSENLFMCGCDLVWFRHWASQNNNSLLDLPTYLCRSPARMEGVPFIQFDTASIWTSCHWLELIYICVGIAFLLTTVLAIVVYKYRWKILVHYYFARHYMRMRQSMTECTTENDDDPLMVQPPEYDAIISADDHDTDFVENFFLPIICARFKDDVEEDGEVSEGQGARHNICYPKTDIEWGQSTSQFAEMAQPNRSSKMLIVLSEKYMQTPSKADFELCVARHRRKEEGKHVIIIIFIGSPELYAKATADIRMILNDQQTVIWNQEWQKNPTKYKDAIKVFYERVKDLLDKPD